MTAAKTASTLNPTAPKGWRISLWIAQILLAAMYIPSGLMKLTQPLSELARQMAWTADLPQLVRIAGAADLAAGLGLILPALTRIAPRLTVWAAIGATVLQVFAMVLHASRGEFGVLPINAILIALQLFVIWGRTRKAPIAPR
ncbi:MAG TPA: DoxX family protein [Ramlibacter sp.]|nr:DoxX family protein [Ramlibacter sp.]